MQQLAKSQKTGAPESINIGREERKNRSLFWAIGTGILILLILGILGAYCVGPFGRFNKKACNIINFGGGHTGKGSGSSSSTSKFGAGAIPTPTSPNSTLVYNSDGNYQWISTSEFITKVLLSVCASKDGYLFASHGQLLCIYGEPGDSSGGTGNSDTISSLHCGTNQVIKWDGSAWVCADDNVSSVSYLAGNGLRLSGTTFSIRAPTCSNGQVLTWNGSYFVCVADQDTTYSAGSGLQLSGTTFSLNARIDLLTDVDTTTNAPTNGQVLKWDGTNWVPGEDEDTDTLASLSCSNGQVAKWDGSAWVCGDDNDTDTTYSAGRGLTLNGTTFDTNTPTSACPSGQVLTWDGNNFTCVADQDTTYNAGNGLSLSGTTFSIGAPTCNGTDKLVWNGTQFVCSADQDTTYNAGTGLQLTGTTFSLNAGIDLLTDVDTTTNAPTNGQVLKWDGSNWVPQNDTDTDTLASLSCSNGQVAKWDGSNWVCAADEDTDTTYSAGNGLQLNSTTFSVDAPTCSGTDKLQWNGTAFVCSADQDTNIYNSNGVLSAERTVNLDGNNLLFQGSGKIGIGASNPTAKLEINNSAVTEDAFHIYQDIDKSIFAEAIGGIKTDYSYSAIETSDGGYLAVGETYSHGAGQDDMYVVKLRGDGSLDSNFGSGGTLTVGGSAGDGAKSVIETSDGGYLVAGWTYSYGAGDRDMYVVKLRGDGSLDSNFGSGGTLTVGGSAGDGAKSVIETSDGGYLVAGWTYSYGAGNSDMYVVKLRGDGSLDSNFGSGGTLTVGGSASDGAVSVIETSDGGYLVVGWTDSYGAGDRDMYVVKLRGDGSLDSNFGSGGTLTVGGSASDGAESVIETSDGGYLVVGWTESYGAGDSDMYVVKLRDDGSLDSNFGSGGTLTIGGSASDGAESVIETSDGGYLVTGWTESYGAGYEDMYVVKLRGDGGLDSNFGSGGTLTVGGSANERAESVIETSDGRYLVVGGTYSYGAGHEDMYVVKLREDGSLDSNFGSGGTLTIGGSSYDAAYAVMEASDGRYLVAGWTESYGSGSADSYVVKLKQDGTLDSTCGSPVLGSGGTMGSGGALGSGGTIGPGGTTNSAGGTIGSGGTLSQQCSVNSTENHLIFNVNKRGFVGVGIDDPRYRLELPNMPNNGGRARANAWITYSDARIKSNQKELAYGLDTLMKLHPKEYIHHSTEFIHGKLIVKPEGTKSLGFIAQEVYKVIPEVVYKPEDESKDLWSMDYEKLIPIIVKAVQELNEKVANGRLNKCTSQTGQTKPTTQYMPFVKKLQKITDDVFVGKLAATLISTEELKTQLLNVADKLQVDKDGKLTVKGEAKIAGKVKANELEVQKLSIGHNNAGTVVIPKGQTNLEVKHEYKKGEYIVSVTSTTAGLVQFWVEKKDNSFVIHLPKAIDVDATFDYVIIHTVDAT